MKCREIGKSAGNPLNLLPPVNRKAFRDAIITISIASASDQKISHAVSTIHDQFTPRCTRTLDIMRCAWSCHDVIFLNQLLASGFIMNLEYSPISPATR
jgi:hypothetical protein